MIQNLREYFYSFICLLIASLVAVAGYNQDSILNGYPILILCMSLSFIIHWLFFLPSFIMKTEKFYDITGTFAYLIIVFTALFLTRISTQEPLSLRTIICSSFIIIWSLRLGLFLLVRVINVGEDKRFAKAKKSFSKFFMFFSISALWVFLTTANSLTMIINNSSMSNDLFFMIGFSISLTGFILEVIADRQKKLFRLNYLNKGRFITTGLWSVSRHPNYLGEIMIWVGMSITSFPVLIGWQFITLISPIFVIILLTKISGVNLLEEQADMTWGSENSYQMYKKVTPVLVPFLKIK